MTIYKLENIIAYEVQDNLNDSSIYCADCIKNFEPTGVYEERDFNDCVVSCDNCEKLIFNG